MRTAIGALALLVTVAFVTGCDTTQPLQVDSQTVDITVSAPSALVAGYDTWVMFEDKNANGLSDDDYDGDGSADEFLWCQAPFTGPVLTSAASAPWPFSFEVSVIREGSIVLERVSTAAALSGNGNLASYDTVSTIGGFKPALNVTHPAGTCSGNADILCDPTNPRSIACSSNGAGSCVAGSGNVTRTFGFTNGRKLSAAAFEVLNSVTNPLYQIDPETTCQASPNAGVCITNGPAGSPLIGRCDYDVNRTCDPTRYPRCPGVDFGPAKIDGGPSPFSVEIANGDTVIVRARRLNTAPLGFNPASLPGLSSSLLVDGQLVNVEGSTSQSANNPESSINYSFTSR